MSLIEVRGLCKSFGSLSVLENVSLTVEEGEKIAIIGGSGCGKSVFLRSLELLEKPDKGQIFIDGREITAKGADIPSIRRSMGMVYQQFYLFSHLSVMDNLCLAPCRLLGMSRKEAEAKAFDWLRQVGLTSKAYEMPAVLSGGQKQRIAICRSLMMEPKVLLFDEPTSALDPTMVGEVLAMIRMLSKRRLTMLIVTHEMNFAREVSDRVLFFADRGIYEQGSPSDIFDHPKGEKTIAFIHKLKFFHYEIHSADFDLLEMQGGIHSFAEKYGLDSRLNNRLQLCTEELVFELLSGCYEKGGEPSVNVDISFSESDQTTSITLTCGGKPFDLFSFADEETDCVHLGITIVRQVAKQYSWKYEDGANTVQIIL